MYAIQQRLQKNLGFRISMLILDVDNYEEL